MMFQFLRALVFIVCIGSLIQAQTANPRLQKKDLIYQGAFRVPEAGALAFGGGALAYNTANHSLFITDRSSNTAEISIPALVNSTNLGSLNTATILQPFADITEGRLPNINPGDPNGKDLAGQLVYNEKLIATGTTYYDAGGTQVLSHFTSSTNLSQTGDVQGPFQVGTVGAGFVSGYMTLIPPEWQNSLGGPAITGQCCLAIITRTSSGPAAFVFNPVDVGTINPVPATPLVYYDYGHQTLGQWGASGANPVYNGTSGVCGIVFPGGTRTLLFIGRNGIGSWCYGTGYDCGDQADASKGSHAYPYVYQMWAYDANDLVAAKNGQKKPWDVIPYAVWTFNLPYETDDMHKLGGAAYDSASKCIFIIQLQKDPGQYGSFYGPIIHVLKVVINESSAIPIRSENFAQEGIEASPNPFIHGTGITVKVPLTKGIPGARIGIFNVHGRLILERQVAGGRLSEGIHWDASNMESGVYIVKARVGAKVLMKAVTLLK